MYQLSSAPWMHLSRATVLYWTQPSRVPIELVMTVRSLPRVTVPLGPPLPCHARVSRLVQPLLVTKALREDVEAGGGTARRKHR